MKPLDAIKTSIETDSVVHVAVDNAGSYAAELSGEWPDESDSVATEDGRGRKMIEVWGWRDEEGPLAKTTWRVHVHQSAQ